MVKKVNLVDREAMKAGTVIEVIDIQELDTRKFSVELRKMYGGNAGVRNAVRKAIEEADKEEATLYVPFYKPVEMILLPTENLMKYFEKAMEAVLVKMLNTNFRFAVNLYDDWVDMVDDSVSNYLEALFYLMANNSRAYENEKCHKCWKYILELAERDEQNVIKDDRLNRMFVLDIALLYTQAGPDRVEESCGREYENYYSVGYRLGMRIGAYIAEEAIMNRDTFFKDEKGWNLYFSTRVRTSDNMDAPQDITYCFVLNDESDEIEMSVLFDNPKNKRMSGLVLNVCEALEQKGLLEQYGQVKMGTNTDVPMLVFSIQHKGIYDYDFLEEIEKLMQVCSLAAVQNAK